MKCIRLGYSGNNLTAPDNFMYFNDGAVESIHSHISNLACLYGMKDPVDFFNKVADKIPLFRGIRDSRNGHPGHFGRVFYNVGARMPVDYYLSCGIYVNAHAFVASFLSDEERTYTMGHEEGHVILDVMPGTSGRQLIQSEFEREGLRNMELDGMGKEEICDANGWLALRRNYSSAGIPIQRLQHLNEGCYKDYFSALERRLAQKASIRPIPNSEHVLTLR